MRKLESRFNYKYYFLGLLVLFVPILLGTMGAWVLIENISKGEAFKEWGFTIAMPVVCLLFIFATIMHFYRLSPRIIITNTDLTIGKKKIDFSEIKIISVRAKSSENFLFIPYRFEASILTLSSNEEVVIAVENYINGNVIRMNLNKLKDNLLGKSKTFEVVERDENFRTNSEIIDIRTATKYMQTPFKSINNYFFVAFCSFMIWLMFQMTDVPIFVMLFPLLMFCMFYLVLIAQNHYFILTDKHLIIKNLFLPTRKHIFKIDNIDYVETEDLPKQETALKVMTKNFKIHRFQSGLMTYEMYTDLIRKINERQQSN